MKIVKYWIYLVVVLLLLSCRNNDPNLNFDPKVGFCLKINDSIVYDYSQIEFYDFSSHFIYLKKGRSFSYSGAGSFTVSADNTEIYSGKMFPAYLSSLPLGVTIPSVLTFYGDFIIPINFDKRIDYSGNEMLDPRGDQRIVETLKKHNQFREGLACEIVDVQKTSANKIQLKLRLTNKDNENLYYLDPDKMGLELFHYFTNGLLLRNTTNKTFTHKITAKYPEPWNSWKMNWLSIIKSKESKTIIINYDNFESVTSGQYDAFFNYPGMSSQIEKKDLYQLWGRIWLGTLYLTKKIQIE
ncbi:MAG: hypothetical protein Q7U47_08075 [Paludibacter sp.]|nr:hypothetical protein [Paludibacter sp.]